MMGLAETVTGITKSVRGRGMFLYLLPIHTVLNKLIQPNLSTSYSAF